MDLNLDATELRLGLPGTSGMEISQRPSSSSSNSLHNKRSSAEMEKSGSSPVQKQQVVGWPPVRSSYYRKNILQQGKNRESEDVSGVFVKVSMDGAPYLRKVDLKFHSNYSDLLKALESMFQCRLGEKESEFAPTYEDKDGDWMLVGDVPWEMFVTCCRRMRIMRASEAKGLQVQQLLTK